MSKAIIGGPNVKVSGNRASDGGRIEPKELPYSQPVGPKHQHEPGPNLRGGTNHGKCGTQGKH